MLEWEYCSIDINAKDEEEGEQGGVEEGETAADGDGDGDEANEDTDTAMDTDSTGTEAEKTHTKTPPPPPRPPTQVLGRGKYKDKKLIIPATARFVDPQHTHTHTHGCTHTKCRSVWCVAHSGRTGVGDGVVQRRKWLSWGHILQKKVDELRNQRMEEKKEGAERTVEYLKVPSGPEPAGIAPERERTKVSTDEDHAHTTRHTIAKESVSRDGHPIAGDCVRGVRLGGERGLYLTQGRRDTQQYHSTPLHSLFTLATCRFQSQSLNSTSTQPSMYRPIIGAFR